MALVDDWDSQLMYIDVDWETVNSIKGIYTAMTIPNTISSFFIYCHDHVL